MSNMSNIIRNELTELEKTESVQVLYACESGSRAWGFESPDSDYDVRFIYVRPREHYLRLDNTRDVLEWRLDDELDINGWDLDKALRLAYKSNPVLFEWLASPVVYKNTEAATKIKEAIEPFYSLKSSLFHYLHMADGNYRKYLVNREEVKHKKYLYVLRPLLVCMWILQKGTQPPMEFVQLRNSVLRDDMQSSVNGLLDIKRSSSELATGKPIPSIDCYIRETMDYVLREAGHLHEDKHRSWDGLNSVFLSII